MSKLVAQQKRGLPFGKIRCQRCGKKFNTPASLDQHVAATHDNCAWRLASMAKAQAHAEQRASKPPPICPVCQQPAKITATKYGPLSQCCGMRSWDLKPLAAPNTLAARVRAHAAFDPLWKDGRMSRGEAYRRLAIAMNMTLEQCHISLMGEREADRVVEIAQSGLLLEDVQEVV